MALKIFRQLARQLVSTDANLRKKYQSFKQLLEHDHLAHELLAEFEDIFYNYRKADIKSLEKKYEVLAGAVSGMVCSLQEMSVGTYDNLTDYFTKIDSYLRFINKPEQVYCGPPYTLFLDEIGPDSAAIVGGKAFNLALLKRNLELPVPEGFVVTTNAFHCFNKHNNLQPVIDQQLALLDCSSPSLFTQISEHLVPIINNGRIPLEVEEDILTAFAVLKQRLGEKSRVALRSSAVAEDSALSFAGQYSSLLNVGEEGLLTGYKKVVASKYLSRALAYRLQHGILDTMTPMAVAVIEMIDAAVSGVITTANLENDESETLEIHSVFGLGGPLVGGETPADIITIKKGSEPKIIRSRLADKQEQMLLRPGGQTQRGAVEDNRRLAPSLSDEQAISLCRIGMTIESYYQCPQEIEWCIDRSGSLQILQSRILAMGKASVSQSEVKTADAIALLQGGVRAAGGIGQGRVFKIANGIRLDEIPPESILVVDHILPVFASVIERLRAVVAEQGSVVGHFASVAREFGVPVLVNVEGAVTVLAQSQEVTVDADNRVVYAGIVFSNLREVDEPRSFLDSPFRRKLQYMIRFISPLNLVDPKSSSFVPESCRSLHDIIRFAHEKSMDEMFSTGTGAGIGTGRARRLVSDLPLPLLVLDVGGGLAPSVGTHREFFIEDVRSTPWLALWQGLTSPGIEWSGRTHYDWDSYDSVLMAGGVANKQSSAFASYAVIAADYLNVSFRFGYHYTILDAICGERPSENYIILRFAGGGGDFYARSLRVKFLAAVLGKIGFSLEITGDLVNAKILQLNEQDIKDKLNVVGRLLGVTRLLDMVLKDEAMVQFFIDEFWAGRYSFSPCQGQ